MSSLIIIYINFSLLRLFLPHILEPEPGKLSYYMWGKKRSIFFILFIFIDYSKSYYNVQAHQQVCDVTWKLGTWLWFEAVIYRKDFSSSKTCPGWWTTFGVSWKQVTSSSLPDQVIHNYNLPSSSLRENGCPTGYPEVSFILWLFISCSIHNQCGILPHFFKSILTMRPKGLKK